MAGGSQQKHRMSTELPSFRVFRPLVGIVLTVLLVLLVAADRAFGEVHPLGIEPRIWAAIVFPIQILCFGLLRSGFELNRINRMDQSKKARKHVRNRINISDDPFVSQISRID